MNYYIFICHDTKKSATTRKSVREAYLLRLNELKSENRLLHCGNTLSTDESKRINGSVIIASFNSLNEAQAWIAQDPYVTAQVFDQVIVKPYQEELECQLNQNTE